MIKEERTHLINAPVAMKGISLMKIMKGAFNLLLKIVFKEQWSLLCRVGK